MRDYSQSAHLRWKRVFEVAAQPSRRSAITEVCDGLATLLDAGLPLQAALKHMQSTGLGQAHESYIRLGAAALEKGLPLSTVWRPLVPKTLLSLLLVGEYTGKLPHVLREWSNHMQERKKWGQQIARLISYPALLVFMTAGVLLFASNVLLPSFTSMYAQLNFPISRSTRMLVDLLANLPTCLLAAGTTCGCGLCVLWAMRVKWPKTWAALERRLPGATMRRLGRTHSLCQLLGLFVSAGVPAADALQALTEVAGPIWCQQACQRIRERILSGASLSDAFAGDWDPLLPVMLGYAEKTGDLATSLLRVEEYTQNMIRRSLERMVGVLQPALILFIGLVVTCAMLTVFIPMYDLMTTATIGKAG